MKQFARAYRRSARYPATVVACFATALMVAALWAGSFAALWPVVDAVMKGDSIPAWLAKEIEADEARLAGMEAERRDIAQKFAHASPDQADRLAADLAENRRQQANLVEKTDWVRWSSKIAERWLPDTAFETLLYVCGFMLAATLLKNLFRVINLVMVARLGNLVAFDLRRDYFRQLLRLDMGEFNQQGRGDLMNRATTDAGNVGVGVQALFGQAVREPLKMIACFVMAAWFSWRLLLLVITVTPIAIYAIQKLAGSLKRANRRAMEELSGVYESLTETLGAIRLIRTFTRESAERAHFNQSLRQLYQRQQRIAFYNSLASPMTENLGVVMVIVAAIAGGYLVLNEQTHLLGFRISDTPLTHGQMSVFFGLLAGMADPARRLSGIFNVLQLASASSERVYAVLDREPTITDPADPKPLPADWKTLRFESVSFQYTPEQLTLDGVDLEIRRGETVAFVGPNGCGKSTLLSLPPRLYDPVEGAVLLGDVDLREAKLRDVRRRIGVVSQAAELLAGTVAENIAFGRPGASRVEVEHAARQAHAHKFITERLANGYDTLVGPGGGRLSGGQRQRIALARAILRNPELLILDEATSQVDLQSERLIQETLAEFVRDRTTLLITHRPATLTLADRIVVMEQGRVVDVGTADELEGRCELFRRLCCSPLLESA